MLNSIALMGRLTAEPELKRTPSGYSVTSFTLAVERNMKPKNGERQTDFINMVAWGSQAELICKYFRKGQMMAATGELQQRRYTTKDGKNAAVYEVIVHHVSFCGDKKPGSSQQPQTATAAAEPPISMPGGDLDEFEDILTDDEVPF